MKGGWGGGLRVFVRMLMLRDVESCGDDRDAVYMM